MVAHCEAYIDFEADELSDPRLSDTFIKLTEDVSHLMLKLQTLIDK